MKNLNEIRTAIKATTARSAWERGVKAYALDLLAEADEAAEVTREALLNGARDWCEYSEGGRALIHNEAIAGRLCTASDLARTHNGERQPSSRECWLDVQARALAQAAALILRTARS